MTVVTLKADVGPLEKRDTIPIPMAILMAGVISSPVWLAIGWGVGLFH